MNSPQPQYVVAIGGASVDITGVPANRLRGRDSNPGTIGITCGGVARNVAEDLARLGVDSRLITVLGNDQYGEMIIALARTAGIDMQYVRQIDSEPTATYLAIFDESGDMQVAIADMNIMAHVTPDWLATYRHVLDKASVVIVEANLSAESIAWITDEFPDATIFADTVSSTKAPALMQSIGRLHTLKSSVVEIEAMTELCPHSDDGLNAIADHLHDQGLERLFVTRGDHGIFYSTQTDRASMPPLHSRDTVSSTSGAGDAFLAGLAYAWLENWPLEQSVRFAVAAAEITVADRATSSPRLSLSGIERYLEQ